MNEAIERLLNDCRLKWAVFAYNYRWSEYVFLFDGWVAKCAMAIPIVGYLIVFNDAVSQHLSFNRLASETTVGFGLSSGARLKLIYFGLIFLGSANILYRLRRPFVFKLGTSQFEYVENALKHFTVSAYIDIHGVIRHEGHFTLGGKYYDAEYDAFLDVAAGRKTGDGQRDDSTADWTGAKHKYEGLLRSMLAENYFRNDIKRRVSLTTCLVLSSIGYFLLLIPSSDLFLKVIAVSITSLGL
jgi:hypothetical protein